MNEKGETTELWLRTTDEAEAERGRFSQADLIHALQLYFDRQVKMVVLTYNKNDEPADEAEAEQRVERFLRQLDAAFELEGRKLAFIRRPVETSNGRYPHHHLVIPFCARQRINGLWPYGATSQSTWQCSGEDLPELALYMLR